MGQHKVKTPDGNIITVNAPDGASPKEVLAYAKSHYKPSLMQHVKTGLGKIGSKAVDMIPTMSGRESAASAGGQLLGGALGGLKGATIGAGLGSMAGKAGIAGGPPTPSSLMDVGATALMARYAPKKLGQEMFQSGKSGAEMGALTEGIPYAWRGAKAAGRELVSGMSSMSGVGERVAQIKKLPLWEQLKVLNPFSKIPNPEVAGAAQGKVEEKLGIPTLKQVTKERIYAEKSPVKVGKTQIKGMPPLEGMSPENRSIIGTILKGLKDKEIPISPKAGESTPIMRSVKEAFEKKVEPTVKEAVQALRDTYFRAGKLAEGAPEGPVYAEQAKKINDFLESKVKELMEARHVTHLSNLKDELLHILPQAPSGEPYRFGVMRLIWMLRTSISVLSGGLMSPVGSGVSAVGGDLATKALDPILGSKLSPAIASSVTQALKRKRVQP